MSIRVISGSAKGKKLKLVPGDGTRPIMDRVKESLFNILGGDVRECLFLDLFAGTGSVGIEALSRGAARAVMLDIDAGAVRTIQENLRLTRLEDRAIVRRQDAFAFLRGQPETAFDFIYIAPPQYQKMWVMALRLLDDNPDWIAEHGMIVAQIDPTERAELDLKSFALVDERRYGNTLLYFFQRTAARMSIMSPERPTIALETLEAIADELLTLYEVSAPPVPLERMLQEPRAGMWHEVNIMEISLGFLKVDSAYAPRMSLARFLARVISSTAWAQARGMHPFSDDSPLYQAFARMLVMPASLITELGEDARTPSLMSVHFEVPEEEAAKRLNDLRAQPSER